MIHKVVIIGAGPAGLTAGIYTGRSNLKPILITGMQPGGQLTTTTKVENWPGETEIMGPKLMMQMQNQAKSCNCEIIMDIVDEVDFSKAPYKIVTKNKKEFLAESVIIATGASHRKLNIPGEQEYFAKGVSVCATCDAPFFRDKEIIVVGGGDSAIIEAEHLANHAKKVTIVQILDELTASDLVKKDRVVANPKIKIILSTALKEIKGDGQKVTSVILENKKDNQEKEMTVDGVFVAIGLKPNSDLFKDFITVDDYGYITPIDKTKTSVEGVFVAGDVADYKYRQAITSAGAGCMAALDCQSYLNQKG